MKSTQAMTTLPKGISFEINCQSIVSSNYGQSKEEFFSVYFEATAPISISYSHQIIHSKTVDLRNSGEKRSVIRPLATYTAKETSQVTNEKNKQANKLNLTLPRAFLWKLDPLVEVLPCFP